MPGLIRIVPTRTVPDTEADPHLREEWLVTNGLGGYASGTVTGAITRRYHGLLIAALQNPFGRMMMLNGLSERIRFPDRTVAYTGAEELSGSPPQSIIPVKEFRLEAGLPVWRYEANGYVGEKRLLMPYRQNTVFITYRLLKAPAPLRLGLRPAIHFRPHDSPVSGRRTQPYTLTVVEDHFEVSAGPEMPVLRMIAHGKSVAFTFDRKHSRPIDYLIERSRGYEAEGSLWSPGYFRCDLSEGEEVTLVASTESWDAVRALTPEEALRSELERRCALVSQADPSARSGVPAELVLAADQFIVTPVSRPDDAARSHAVGGEVRTVIAGYHWFTDWGRDTMISLEGLTLSTGRQAEAGWILRTFAHYVRDGLIPNMFPEGEKEGLYHTADASLWFFHAVDRYVERSGDRILLRFLLPKLVQIVEAHTAGTRFGIAMDPSDSLLREGQVGYQLTWMDAKVGDWVVTPRRGKAVEINALWYNALRVLERRIREEQGDPAAAAYAACADRVGESFNRRFWYAEGGYLYDVVDGEDGDDAALRPNQLLAVSLPNPILREERWKSVVDITTERLLTPFGLRTLAPGHPEYKAQYYGDLRSRDAAYHQGTVWPWLIGPYIDARLKVYPNDREGAARLIEGFASSLNLGCIGNINEIFDAEEPYMPRGCIAQAWSVAEVLRTWIKTHE